LTTERAASGMRASTADPDRLAPSRPAEPDEDEREPDDGDHERGDATEHADRGHGGHEDADCTDHGEAPVAHERGEEERERAEHADHGEAGHGLRHEHDDRTTGRGKADPVRPGGVRTPPGDVEPQSAHDPREADGDEESDSLTRAEVVSEDELGRVDREHTEGERERDEQKRIQSEREEHEARDESGDCDDREPDVHVADMARSAGA